VPTPTDAQLLEYGDWVFRYRPAAGAPSRLLLMVHGLSGDENSMWIFTRSLPAQTAAIAPRGLSAYPNGGFTWRRSTPTVPYLPVMDELRGSAEALIGFMDEWPGEMGLDARQFDLMGFSQGAALCYTIAILHPERIRALAILSGFIPDGADGLLSSRPLDGKPIFISHGRQDDMVPVERARNAVALLQGSGAQVTYCETDGGHKVSAECFAGLSKFLH
jgi:phospholipase/carboxylesterase